MARPVARYSITYGLEGMYMPDSHAGAYEVFTRADLASLIRATLADYDMPSTAHFRLIHGGNELAFHGLTSDEYEEQSREE